MHLCSSAGCDDWARWRLHVAEYGARMQVFHTRSILTCDAHLDELRHLLADIPDDLPIADAVTRALVAFNTVPPQGADGHRRRMQLLLGVPSLQAHSMLMYADWRHVIAEFCAHRLGLDEDDHLPQTIGWMCLGTALAAYEQWLNDPDSDLESLIRAGCEVLANGVAALH